MSVFKDLLNVHEWTIIGSKKCGKTNKLRAEYPKHLLVDISEISKKRGQTEKEFIQEFKIIDNRVCNAPLLFHNGKLIVEKNEKKKTKLIMKGKKLISISV